MSTQILLKPKREYGKKLPWKNSPFGDYLDFIDELNQNRAIEILRAETELYQLVGKSLLVVGIPFTPRVISPKELYVAYFYFVPNLAKNGRLANVKMALR